MAKQFDILPYVGFGDLRFGMKKSQVENIVGPAEKTTRSPISKETKEMRRKSGLQIVYSELDESVVEINIYPGIKDVKFKDIDVFRENGYEVVKRFIAEDDKPVETVGISIFTKLGISITGFTGDDDSEQKSLSIFIKGRWDSDLGTAKPFKFKK